MLSRFKQLREDGEGCVLEGSELDSALQMLSQAGQDLSADELRCYNIFWVQLITLLFLLLFDFIGENKNIQ
jgi:hypothetical protein